MPNPFAPKRRTREQHTPAPAGPVALSRAELDDMRKADLVALAQERGVDDDGTKADLVDRLSP